MCALPILLLFSLYPNDSLSNYTSVKHLLTLSHEIIISIIADGDTYISLHRLEGEPMGTTISENLKEEANDDCIA